MSATMAKPRSALPEKGLTGSRSVPSFGETARGAILLTKYLTDRGAVVPEGWDLTVASLISADGTTVYGWGFNPDNLVEMFKVELK